VRETDLRDTNERDTNERTGKKRMHRSRQKLQRISDEREFQSSKAEHFFLKLLRSFPDHLTFTVLRFHFRWRIALILLDLRLPPLLYPQNRSKKADCDARSQRASSELNTYPLHDGVCDFHNRCGTDFTRETQTANKGSLHGGTFVSL